MKALLRILPVLGIVLLLISILFFFVLSEPSQNARLVSISQKQIKNDIEVTASIRSEHQYTLYSPVEGIISNIQYNLGDEVYKNQTLANIEKKQTELTDTQTETRLRNLVAQYSLSIQQNNDELAKINNAVNAGVLPRYKLDEVRSSLERSRAKQVAAINELNSYQSDKRNKRNNVKKQTKINALSGGIITKKFAYEGQWIRRGDAILDIVSTDDLTISTMLSPKQVQKITLGQEVLVSKQNLEKSWIEQIIRISPIISQDPNTKNLQEVTISLVNANEINKTINEKVKIKIKNLESNINSISLPIDAVIRDGKKFYVLYVDTNYKVTLSDIYNKNGFISALQQYKCQFSSCGTSVYRLLKKYIQVGSSDIDSVQISSDLGQDIKIVVPNLEVNKDSLVILEHSQ